MSKDLRQFLQSAKEAGPDFYVEVKKPLKPKLEVHVIQTKLQREGRYPVVYCPEIEGSKLRLVTNLFNSYELLALALGMNPKTTTKPEMLREYRKRRDATLPLQEIPAAESVTVTEVPAVKPKEASKKPRSKARPRAKRAVKPQRLSFGQWLLFNLSEDSPAAIFVLVLIFCLVLSGLAALGYGLYFLHSNL